MVWRYSKFLAHRSKYFCFLGVVFSCTVHKHTMFVLMVVLACDLLEQFLEPTFIDHTFIDFCEDHNCSLTFRVDAVYEVKIFVQRQIASHINYAQNDRFLHQNIFPNQVATFFHDSFILWSFVCRVDISRQIHERQVSGIRIFYSDSSHCIQIEPSVVAFAWDQFFDASITSELISSTLIFFSSGANIRQVNFLLIFATENAWHKLYGSIAGR